jgi:hypothetical protein
MQGKFKHMEIQECVNNIIQGQVLFSNDLVEFGKNLNTHVSAIQDLKLAVGDLTGVVKEISDIVKESQKITHKHLQDEFSTLESLGRSF